MGSEKTRYSIAENSPIYISEEFLSWPVDVEYSEYTHVDWLRHYEPLNHAMTMLKRACSDEDRACAIFQLRRSLEFREKALRSIYHLDKLCDSKMLKATDILVDCGVILPNMRRKLIEIRNCISHNDDELPPSTEVCCELAEFLWYYMKSTDQITREINSSLCFQEDNGSGYVCINISFKKNTVYIHASMAMNLIKTSEYDGYIYVEAPYLKIEKENIIFGNKVEHMNSTILKPTQKQMRSILSSCLGSVR